MPTNLQKSIKYLQGYKVSGSKSTVETAQKAAVDKQGWKYRVGGAGSNNLFRDRNGKILKQNNVVKFTPSFLGNAPGNWQIFSSASKGRSTGDGEITLVNNTNGWNFTFDSAKHKNFISASFIEFVDDGPT